MHSRSKPRCPVCEREKHLDGLPLQFVEPQTDMSRQPTESVSDDIRVGSESFDARDQLVTQPHEARRLLSHFRASYLAAFSKPTMPATFSVPDPCHSPARRPEGTDGMEFLYRRSMPRRPLAHSACEPIGTRDDPVALHINRQLADRLHRIGMEYRAVVTGDTRRSAMG